MSGRCPIGSLGLHTMNHERTECIWCGPNKLAWKDGKWVDNGNGTDAWSASGILFYDPIWCVSAEGSVSL